MGASLNVEFNKKVAPYGTLSDDHNALGNGLVRLDKILAAAGLTGLGAFVSADPGEWEDMDEDDPHASAMPAMKWFNPAEGLKAVRAAIALLMARPRAISGSAEVLTELAQVEAALAAAAKRKAMFHFLICD